MRVCEVLTASLVAVLLIVEAHAQTAVGAAVRHPERVLSGLAAPAEIIVDRAGVAHIYAASDRDAYFLQGYNAARDRLFQIDLWRKRGLGLLARSFGPAYVEQDRAARLFLYRGDMEKEWNAYAPDARAIVSAFTEGVNAYVAEVRNGTRPLPVEFRLTDTLPDSWREEDILRIRSHALVSNLTQEVARARTLCAGSDGADALRRKLAFGYRPFVPDGLDPCAVPRNVLDVYQLATSPVAFDVLDPQRQSSIPASPDLRLAEQIREGSMEGSNNWVISAGKSATGRPVMANDPHRALGLPSLRYVVGLNAPGLSVIGAGEPALPGISLGHNGQIAFGLTIFAMDQEDLYIYETRPDRPDQYRYRGRWETMRTVTETIDVRGAPPVSAVLRFTRHGPVIADDAADHRAFAVRTVWAEPGLAGYFGSSRLLRAKGLDDFRAAAEAWGAPPLNLVYADAGGDIAWSAAGRTPVRRNWDGLLPVPGDGRYEWDGFLEKGALPFVSNPEKGFFATANEMNLPDDYPALERKIAFEWADPSRAERIHAALSQPGPFAFERSMALQTDAVSHQALKVISLLKGLKTGDDGIDRIIADLLAWNGEESVDSAEAAVYEVWASRYLGAETVSRTVPLSARELVGQGHIEAVYDLLSRPDARLGPDPEAARRDILAQSLARAVEDLEGRLGADRREWSWGRLHAARWEHPLSPLADPQLAEQMSLQPLQTPGSGSTPRAQSFRSADFSVISGASVRLVIDVGDWDRSVMINSPGQSADPFSAHYRDLYPLWAEGRYVPLPFSRAAVEANAAQVMTFSPQAPRSTNTVPAE